MKCCTHAHDVLLVLHARLRLVARIFMLCCTHAHDKMLMTRIVHIHDMFCTCS